MANNTNTPTIIDTPLFLGLDLSTQQVKAVVVQEDTTIVHESAVHFDNDLPEYKTTSGAHTGPDVGEVTSPVAMWLDALEILMQRMTKAGVDLKSIVAVSGAGQQHGSVYWSHTAEEALAALDPSKPLNQLSPHAFSTPNAPIWQDSSTTQECRDLEDAVGGAQALADLSGSRGYERFTGTQISKYYHKRREIYEATGRISLVSSFIAALFLGTIPGIEVSDASGMNLMNILTCQWDDTLLEACGGKELRGKLGPEPAPGGTTLGKVGSYFTQRWGFNPDMIVAPFTGDNSSTVIATLNYPGDALLSLGTSTTFLVSIPPASEPPSRFTSSHLLAHPTTSPDATIAMLCYKNGALAREQVRNAYAKSDWAAFNDCVENTPAGSGGYSGLYFPLPEIIPAGIQGSFFYHTEPATGVTTRVAEKDVPAHLHPRLILESQMLSIRARIAAIMPAGAPPLQRLVVTGGSSANPAIRQFIADALDIKVYTSATKEAAAMGGCYLARYAWWKANVNPTGTFEEMIAALGVDELGMKCVAEPSARAQEMYAPVVPTYVRAEEMALQAFASQIAA